MRPGSEIKFQAVDNEDGKEKKISGGIAPPRSTENSCSAFIKVKGQVVSLSLEGLTVEQLDKLQQLAGSLSDRLKTLRGGNR